MTKKIVALVPMRHHSERVPGKNYRPFAGKPLFHHILKTLQSVPELDAIMVDTDSPVIIAGLERFFPDVVVHLRPNNLRGDTVPMNQILAHDSGVIESEYYLQTHSTNPLLRSATISNAIKTFFENKSQYDSLFGVTRLQTRLWDQDGQPVNHNPSVLLRTQDLPPIYEENSCIYLFSRHTILTSRNRLGEHPFMFEIPPGEALDIDEELDFIMAETIFHQLYD
ncbi:MAG: acylneuraminate cytidylyltransferase family protein [Chloroflexota bacterium]|nr:acylneuraminate cytidylyltransferase family protein [Chloroflexota bacterium]